jgi:hypothetical protein
MIVEGDYSGRRPRSLFRNEYESGNTNIGRGLEFKMLLDIVIVLYAANHLPIRLNGRRLIEQVIKHQRPRLFLPRLKRRELLPQKRQLELRPVRLLLDEGIEVSDMGLRSGGLSLGRCCRALTYRRCRKQGRKLPARKDHDFLPPFLNILRVRRSSGPDNSRVTQRGEAADAATFIPPRQVLSR